jgi:hypothetical protein
VLHPALLPGARRLLFGIRTERPTAVDGDVGHVDGFLVDDDSWDLPNVVVNTLRWWRSNRVLVPTEWIAWMSWGSSARCTSIFPSSGS